MKLTRLAFLNGILFLMILSSFGWAQADGFDEELIALIYHKISGDPVDLRSTAERSEAVLRAPSFDRPDILRSEIAWLQTQLDGANPGREFVVRVNDSISEYDHDRGEFSILLFRAGYYVPMQAFGQQYQVVFANAESARPIQMPRDEARGFDARLSRTGRSVTNVIHFQVVGKGDPAGAVTGARVIRAEIKSARLLDRSDQVLFAPEVRPYSVGGGRVGSTLDIARADVAGFRVGVTARDLEATLNRLFGSAKRIAAKSTDWFAGTLSVHEMGCIPMYGRSSPKPGSVCVTAFIDGQDVVRSIRVERVFAYFDPEILREALTQKYGEVVSAVGGGSDLAWGWGPEVDPKLSYGKAPYNALTAHYANNADFISRSGNALPHIRVVLSLVDPGWALLSGK